MWDTVADITNDKTIKATIKCDNILLASRNSQQTGSNAAFAHNELYIWFSLLQSAYKKNPTWSLVSNPRVTL